MRTMILKYVTWVALGVSLFVAGCATTPVNGPVPTPPNIRLGPVLELLKILTARDKTRVILDNSGRGHVIIASTKLEEVHHIVVGPEGISEREVIRSAISPSSIDAAFDRAGSLHVLIDGEHLIMMEGVWQNSADTPWKKAGIEIREARFVPGAPDLIWAFTVKGEEVGAPGRLDWYGIGGYGAGIIWPWHKHGEKLVVVPEANPACTTWTVLDPKDKLDVNNWQLAADARRNIQAVYDSTRTFFVNATEARYVRFKVEECPPNGAAGTEAAPATKANRLLLAVSGQPIEGQFGTLGLGNQVSLSVDPETGTALFVIAHDMSRLVREAVRDEAIGLPIGTYWEPRLAPAGRDRFHAVVIGKSRNFWTWTAKGSPIYYLEFSDRAWSAPIEVGIADVSAYWGLIWNAIQIGSDGKNRALVVWPIESGIVGRWIEIVQ